MSFHATKVFNTFEGGAIVCPDKKTKERVDYLKNFGFADETTVVAPGINGKMNELQAAVGLAQLPRVTVEMLQRKTIYETYVSALEGLPGITYMKVRENVSWNWSYFPILIDSDKYGIERDELYFRLKEKGVFARRYFYPLISDFPMYRACHGASTCSSAADMSRKVICLPMYAHLTEVDQAKIIRCLYDLSPAKVRDSRIEVMGKKS